MRRLVYASRALTAFDDDSLFGLARVAADRNRASEITGYLHYRRSRFLQYLEGSNAALTALLERLHADARHEIVAITELPDADARSFPDWSMRYLADDALRRIQVEDLLDTVLTDMTRTTLGEQARCSAALRLVDRLAERERASHDGLPGQARFPAR